MKKLLFVLCAILSLAAMSLSAKEVVKIGVILPLSGDNAHLGLPIAHLIRQKISALPENSRFEYKVFYEDDQLTPKKTLLAAKRLVELEKVDVLFTFYTAPGMVVAPYALQSKTLHMAFCYDEASADGSYNFVHVTPIDDEAKLWVDYAKEKGLNKVAFFVHRNSGGEATLKALEKLEEYSGMQWKIMRFNQGQKDFRMAIERIRQFNPDELFLYGFDPEFSIVLKQMRELDYRVPLTCIAVLDQYANKPELEGAWFAAHGTPTPEFSDNYKKVFSEENLPVGVGVYSDMVDLVFKAYEEVNSATKPSHEEVAFELRTMKDFSGAFGALRCDGRGIFRVKPTINVIENSQVHTIEGWPREPVSE